MKIEEEVSRILNQCILEAEPPIKFDIEIKAVRLDQIRDLRTGMITVSNSEFDINLVMVRFAKCKIIWCEKEALNQFKQIDEEIIEDKMIWEAITEEIISKHVNHFRIQYAWEIEMRNNEQIEEDDGAPSQSLIIRGVNRNGVIHTLYNLPELEDVLKEKIYKEEMPEEWWDKEQFLQDLAFEKEFLLKKHNPDMFDEIVEKIEQDFPGFTVRKAFMIQWYFKWKIYWKEKNAYKLLANPIKEGDNLDEKVEKQLYHIPSSNLSGPNGDWQGFRGHYFCEIMDQNNSQFLLKFLENDPKTGNYVVYLSNVVISDPIIEEKDQPNRAVAKKIKADGGYENDREYGWVQFKKQNTTIYAVYKTSKFYHSFRIILKNKLENEEEIPDEV